jgi:uncharacterized membrane protein
MREDRSGLPVNRVEALADGVFAIAMTILVLGLALPHGPASLADRLWSLWPKLASYVVSFVMLGVLWIGHNFQMHHVRRVDRVSLWLNLGFLLAITFLPFGADVLGAEYRDPTAVVLYGGTILLAGAMLLAHWQYVTRRPELIAPDLDPVLAAGLRNRIILGLAISSCSMALAFIDTRLSLVALLALPFGYFRRSHVDARLSRRVR